MRRDAFAYLPMNMGRLVRVSAFRRIDRVSKRFDFDRRFRFQAVLVCGRQAEAEPNAQLVQECLYLGLV
jgi:hypothetical protein